MPRHACDTHAHICGPIEMHPYSDRRIYTPPDAPLAAYVHMLTTLGVERAVLVQPSVYGTDNSVMLGAMAELGRSRCRGVAVVESDIPESELTRMHDAGEKSARLYGHDPNDGVGGFGLTVTVVAAEAGLLQPSSVTMTV